MTPAAVFLSLRCYLCGFERPVDDFARDRSKASGRKSLCRSCDRERSRAYYREHREAVIPRVVESNRRRRERSR
jgi:hypothetical protein